MAETDTLLPIERIASQIYLIRDQKVMLDSDLAALYGVMTGRLNEQVKRNQRRFPEDFAFRLTREEFGALMSQNAISNRGRGGRRKPPWAFTEQGVAMLSSVLRSDRAADVNVAIMRTFVRLRQVLASNEKLARKVAQHDRQIEALFEHVKTLLTSPDPPKKPLIGFVRPGDD
ncbi:MAG: ORF6N domain-containing protein [bacterium]|nr:ORF6N domain-containing protein [bacterium]